jgi:hypothetical protein
MLHLSRLIAAIKVEKLRKNTLAYSCYCIDFRGLGSLLTRLDEEEYLPGSNASAYQDKLQKFRLLSNNTRQR